MFDDLSQNNNQQSGQPATPVSGFSAGPGQPAPVSPRNTAAEDIFAATDTSSKPPIFQPITPAMPALDQLAAESSRDVKKYLMLVGIFVAIIILSGGVYWAISRINEPKIQPVIQKEKEADVKQDDQPNQSNTAGQAGASSSETVISTLPADSDQDGLSDEEEKLAGTDPIKVDTDDDGLFDQEEVRIYKTDPKRPDTDVDGILDGEEVRQSSDPNGAGRLYDLPGTATSTPASVTGSSTKITSPVTSVSDADKDGLNDGEEAQLGTDPKKADTDSDGLNDFQEVKTYKSNPLKADSDGDGYADGQEVTGGYNPNGPGKLTK